MPVNGVNKLILPGAPVGLPSRPLLGAAPYLLQLLPSETYRPGVLLCMRLLRRKIPNNNNNILALAFQQGATWNKPGREFSLVRGIWEYP